MSEICGALEDDKPCTKVARWRPVLRLRVNTRHPPAEVELGIGMCEEHREKRGRVSDWLTDIGWEQICAALRRASKALPDRTLTEVGWRELS